MCTVRSFFSCYEKPRHKICTSKRTNVLNRHAHISMVFISAKQFIHVSLKWRLSSLSVRLTWCGSIQRPRIWNGNGMRWWCVCVFKQNENARQKLSSSKKEMKTSSYTTRVRIHINSVAISNYNYNTHTHACRYAHTRSAIANYSGIQTVYKLPMLALNDLTSIHTRTHFTHFRSK